MTDSCLQGWPSFSMYSTPMASYCVESVPAPVEESPTNSAGWAEYTSCDADEAGELSHPTDPVCICWCSWDRRSVSNQPASVYNKYCTTGADGKEQCTCADALNSSTILIRPDSTSARYVGKSPVMLPYIYYQTPVEVSHRASTKKGLCVWRTCAPTSHDAFPHGLLFDGCRVADVPVARFCPLM